MRRFFEAKAPRDPASSSDESDSSAPRSSVLMHGGKNGARAHSRSQHQGHHAAGKAAGQAQPPAMTFTTNSSILGTTTTTIISKGGKPEPATPASSAARSAAEASGSSSGGKAAAAGAGVPGALDAKTHKKCSVCGKSFNPLRRRHYCRTCTAVVCSSCSISRKVESTFEGSITVRMCVSCKLSAIASQDDFYDRIFASSSAGGAGGPPSGGLGAPPSDGFTGSERLSVASYASNSNASAATAPAEPAPAPAPQPQPDKRAASASGPQPPLRRKSSAVSAARRDSLGSNSAATANGVPFDDAASVGGGGGAVCPLCHNEACAPLREYAEVPYPFFLELSDPNASARSGSPQFVAAKALDNEKERLRSVRALRNALKLSTVPGSQTTLTQLCSMAAIATSSPMALVGLLDKHVYAPVAETGVGHLDKIDRHKSLASHTCRNGGPLVCSELARDVRFAANPWARDALRAGFYAGIPLTLGNGHIVGAVEVFDVKPRYACMDVVAQLQAVVRGLQRKLDEIYAKAPSVAEEFLDGRAPARPTGTPGSGQRRADSVESSHSGHSHYGSSHGSNHGSSHGSSHGSKRGGGSRPPPPSTPAAPPVPAPKKAPAPAQEAPKERTAPLASAAAPVVSATTTAATAAATTTESTPTPTAAPAPAPAPTSTPAANGEKQGEAPANEMEMRLMELLSQTTSTQEQLRNQQSNMVHAISSHSKQIGELAKQLQRMETTLASKLGSDADGKDGVEQEEAPPATAAA